MAEALRPVVRQRLYEQLVERLLEHVRSEGLQPGDRLPSERVLAELLQVSRTSLKQATVVLEVQGIVEVRHGGGIYLLRDGAAGEPLAVLLERRQRLPDVLDAREGIEVKLAELAAARRSAEDLEAVRRALAQMSAAVRDGRPAEDADAAFHSAVVHAAHSPVLEGFYRQIAAAISETRRESLRQPGRPQRSLQQHRRIAEAVAAQDAAAAATAMRDHVRAVGEVRLLVWDPDDDQDPGPAGA